MNRKFLKESEMKNILLMHRNAIKKEFVNEQIEPGVKFPEEEETPPPAIGLGMGGADQCLNLILDIIVEKMDEIIDDAKYELERNGGKFENGVEPSNEDWNEAEDAILDAFKDIEL